MRDHEGQVIGVLQLLNAKHAQTGDPVAFTPEDQDLLQSLASQAAVAFNNVRLIKETEQLFESFVQVMATAIDERSPYTGGHIRRVMEMAMVVAGAVNACESGPFAGVCFSDDELEEFRIAAWMHDIGKITTPEWVVDKPTKLTTIFNRIELLEVRLKFIKQSIQIERLEKEVALLQVGAGLPSDLAQEYDRRLAELDDEIAFLVRANTPGEFMEKADLERVQAIGCKTYLDGGEEKPYLTANEIENLSIDRGTLTEAERQKIQNHAAMSIKMLAQIPFTRKLQQVPPIAGAHHERLNGKGYPLGLKGDEIGLQARILALVDIFESISADDRPYRKKAPQDVVLRILQEEVDKNHLDSALLDLFLEEKLYLKLDEIKEKMAREKQSAEQSAGD